MNTTKAATLKYALSSYKKMELVAKLVRGKTYYDASRMLSFTNKKAAKILLKLLNSAYSNCKNDTSIDLSKVYISTILIGR
jgi:large subunit ribosomal protein L22